MLPQLIHATRATMILQRGDLVLRFGASEHAAEWRDDCTQGRGALVFVVSGEGAPATPNDVVIRGLPLMPPSEES